jgi:hypothetical protein
MLGCPSGKEFGFPNTCVGEYSLDLYGGKELSSNLYAHCTFCACMWADSNRKKKKIFFIILNVKMETS